jgi:hypothetical protein
VSKPTPILPDPFRKPDVTPWWGIYIIYAVVAVTIGSGLGLVALFGPGIGLGIFTGILFLGVLPGALWWMERQ